MGRIGKGLQRIRRVEGLVSRPWSTQLYLRGRFTTKIKVGFGPIATGENDLAERKWRIDPIINEINRRDSNYFASFFVRPQEMDAFDVVVIVKRFHSGYLATIEKMKRRGAKFLYDIVDNPNAGRLHNLFFGDCPEFSSQMDAFILSSPLHEPIAKKFSPIFSLIEHPILNKNFKQDYQLNGPVKILVHGYFENLVPFLSFEPMISALSQEIDRPIHLVFHSERVFPETQTLKCVRWTVKNSFDLMTRMDLALTAKDLSNFYQRAKPSTKIIALLAAGLPVICTPTPADEGVVTHGQNALFAFTAQDWRSHIKTLCQSLALREQLGREGRTLVAARYSLPRIANKYFELLDRVTGRS